MKKKLSFYRNIALSFYRNIACKNCLSDKGLKVSHTNCLILQTLIIFTIVVILFNWCQITVLTPALANAVNYIPFLPSINYAIGFYLIIISKSNQ
jgi:hypothetical protein